VIKERRNREENKRQKIKIEKNKEQINKKI
jgi:hypothetical protein